MLSFQTGCKLVRSLFLNWRSQTGNQATLAGEHAAPLCSRQHQESAQQLACISRACVVIDQLADAARGAVGHHLWRRQPPVVVHQARVDLAACLAQHGLQMFKRTTGCKGSSCGFHARRSLIDTRMQGTRCLTQHERLSQLPEATSPSLGWVRAASGGLRVQPVGDQHWFKCNVYLRFSQEIFTDICLAKEV